MRFGAAPEWPAPATPEDEVELLKAQAEQLQAQLDAVQSRLKDLQED
jgi:prefoldin subunit 5